MTKFFPFRIVCLAALLPLGLPAQLSVSTDGETYTEDFDGLSGSYTNSWTNDSTLAGWFSGKSGYASGYRTIGYPVVSYGTTTAPSDRALGVSLTANDPTAWLSVRFTNDTGVVLHSIVVSYYVEQYYGFADPDYRFSEGLQFWTATDPAITGRPEGDEWTRQTALEYFPTQPYEEDSTGNLGYSNFLGAEILDGNHPDYRTLVTGTVVLSGGLAAGDTLFLMWGNSSDGNGDQSFSDGLAIDNLSVTFSSSLSAVPEPSTYAAIGGLGVLGFAMWRRRKERA